MESERSQNGRVPVEVCIDCQPAFPPPPRSQRLTQCKTHLARRCCRNSMSCICPLRGHWIRQVVLTGVSRIRHIPSTCSNGLLSRRSAQACDAQYKNEEFDTLHRPGPEGKTSWETDRVDFCSVLLPFEREGKSRAIYRFRNFGVHGIPAFGRLPHRGHHTVGGSRLAQISVRVVVASPHRRCTRPPPGGRQLHRRDIPGDGAPSSGPAVSLSDGSP